MGFQSTMTRRGKTLTILTFVGVAGLAASGLGWWIYGQQPSYLLRQGQAAVRNGDLERAEQIAWRLAKQGDYNEQLLLEGAIWAARGRSDAAQAEEAQPGSAEQAAWRQDAEAAFTKALQALGRLRIDDPLAAEASVLGAECLARLGRHRLAAEALQAVLGRHPDHLEAHRWLAAVFMDLNAPTEATNHLRHWARLSPQDARPWRWIGLFCKDYYKPAEAIVAYREALHRSPEPALAADVCRELAEVLVTAEANYRAALETLTNCPAPYNQAPPWRVIRAECLWGLGREAEASAELDEALRADPRFVPALLLRARIHLAADQSREAVVLLERAVAVDPHDHRSRQQLVEALQHLRETQRAEEHRHFLEKTKQIKDELSRLHREASDRPWDDRPRYRIAELCLQLDRTDEARMWLRAALATNPANSEARQTLARLDRTGRKLPGQNGPLP